MAVMYSGDKKLFVITTGTSIESSNDIKFTVWRAGEKVAAILKTKLGGGLSEDSANQFTVTLNKADTINLVGEFYMQAHVIDSSAVEDVIELADSILTIKARGPYV